MSFVLVQEHNLCVCDTMCSSDSTTTTSRNEKKKRVLFVLNVTVYYIISCDLFGMACCMLAVWSFSSHTNNNSNNNNKSTEEKKKKRKDRIISKAVHLTSIDHGTKWNYNFDINFIFVIFFFQWILNLQSSPSISIPATTLESRTFRVYLYLTHLIISHIILYRRSSSNSNNNEQRREYRFALCSLHMFLLVARCSCYWLLPALCFTGFFSFSTSIKRTIKDVNRL